MLTSQSTAEAPLSLLGNASVLTANERHEVSPLCLPKNRRETQRQPFQKSNCKISLNTEILYGTTCFWYVHYQN